MCASLLFFAFERSVPDKFLVGFLPAGGVLRRATATTGRESLLREEEEGVAARGVT